MSFSHWKIDGTENYPEWATGRVCYTRSWDREAGILFNRGKSRKVLKYRTKKGNFQYAEIGDYLYRDNENDALYTIIVKRE